MLDTILDALPPKLRLVIAGGMLAGALFSGMYGLATYAATEAIKPLAARVEKHEADDKKYLYPLLEAIWSDSRALCAANPSARCDGYNPVRPMTHTEK